jgi:hypothetical protein
MRAFVRTIGIDYGSETRTLAANYTFGVPTQLVRSSSGRARGIQNRWSIRVSKTKDFLDS